MSSTAKFDGDSYDLARVPTTPQGAMSDENVLADIAKQKVRRVNDHQRADVVHIGIDKLSLMQKQLGFEPVSGQSDLYNAVKADGVPRWVGGILGMDMYASTDDNECRVAAWGWPIDPNDATA